MSYDPNELKQADRFLAAAGVPHELEDLGNDPRLFRAEYVEPLFALLKEEWKSSYIEMLALWTFARVRLKKAQRLQATAACIDALHRRPDPKDDHVEAIACSLINLADAAFVREIGDLALDRRFGHLCSVFLHALSGLKDPRVSRYFEASIQDPETRLEAFRGLAKRDPAGTLTRMSAFIGDEGPWRGEFLKLYQRLRRKVEGFDAASSPHRLRGRIPAGLPWWSANIDGEDLKPILIAIAAASEGVLSPDAYIEVESSVADLADGRRMRFAFLPPGGARESSLWLDLLAEDEDAYILKVVAGSSRLMDRLEGALEAVTDRLEKEKSP